MTLSIARPQSRLGICFVSWLPLALCAGAVAAPAEPRANPADAPYPRIAMLWSPVRGDRSLESEGPTRSDHGRRGPVRPALRTARPTGLAEGFTAESIARAKRRLAELRKLNPDAPILAELYFYEYRETWLPADHPWWLRRDGKRQQFWPGTYRMDWNNAEYRRHVVKLTAALEQVGFDGVFYDNLRDEPEPWVAFLKEVRRAVSDGFLILANAGYAVGRHDFAAPFLNGVMYESGGSHRAHRGGTIASLRCGIPSHSCANRRSVSSSGSRKSVHARVGRAIPSAAGSRRPIRRRAAGASATR